MEKFRDSDFPPLPPRSRDAGKMSSVLLRPEAQSGVPQVLANINELPDELLVEILNYLPGNDIHNFQLAALVSLSSTNRRFHRLVSAKLYASYNSHFCEPYLFLRTVISNKFLAGLVTATDFKYGTMESRNRNRYTATAQDKKVVKEGLKALLPDHWKNWAADCNTDYIELDFLHTAILMHLPNVTTMIARDGPMGVFGTSKGPRWTDLFRTVNLNLPFGNMHHFRHLHTLQVDNDRLTPTSLMHIFRTPFLRTLRINNLCDYAQGSEQADSISAFFPKSCNDLNELHLGRAFVQNDILALLISTPRRLKTFKYKITVDNVHYATREEELGVTTLVTAIKHQRKSLENLTVIPESDVFRSFNLWQGVQDFPSLKYLSCPLGTIAGGNYTTSLSEKLPLSLLTFHTIIRYMDEQDVEALRALKEMATEWSDEASLHTLIRITVENPVGPWLNYDWARLIRPFSLTRVELVIEGGQALEEESAPRGYRRPFGAVPSDDISSASSEEVSLYSN